jgi:hypothetical protein
MIFIYTPIFLGLPGLDLIDRYPDCCFNLTRNLRTNPRAHYMADAIIHILKGEPENIVWSDALEELQCMTLISARIEEDTLELRAIVLNLLKHIMAHPETYRVNTIADIQFIVFRRTMRDIFNAIVEDCAREIGLLPRRLPAPVAELRRGLWVYVGCKICIRGDSFPATTGGGGEAYDNIRNGDSGVITECRPLVSGGTEIVFVTGALSKRMLVSKRGHVDPAAVHLGHAITTNAAQGCEYNTVVGVFHRGAENEDWICRGHAYVMTSRGKEAFIALAESETVFNRICGRMERRRNTLLKHTLAKVKSSKRTGEATIVDPATLTLNTDKHKPCVPVLEQFVEKAALLQKKRLKTTAIPF